MAFLDERRMHAPDHLVRAVDLVCDCINGASRRVTDDRLRKTIKQVLTENELPPTVWFDVRPENVDIFDGSSDDRHAHVMVRQADANQHYWRNENDPYGSGNFIQ